MFTALVAATLVSAIPSTSDRLTALGDLTTPPGLPVAAERSPRARVAAILALHALGGLDDGAGDFRWFSPSLDWTQEHDYARRIVAVARTAPVDDWLPGREWLTMESAAYSMVADAWRRRAEEYRGRCEWEADRSEALSEWAGHFEREAARYADHACRLTRWAGGSWQCPRRVAVAEMRDWMGADRYSRREWPE